MLTYFNKGIAANPLVCKVDLFNIHNLANICLLCSYKRNCGVETDETGCETRLLNAVS